MKLTPAHSFILAWSEESEISKSKKMEKLRAKRRLGRTYRTVSCAAGKNKKLKLFEAIWKYVEKSLDFTFLLLKVTAGLKILQGHRDRRDCPDFCYPLWDSGSSIGSITGLRGCDAWFRSYRMAKSKIRTISQSNEETWDQPKRRGAKVNYAMRAWHVQVC